jgi:hypothetical protein
MENGVFPTGNGELAACVKVPSPLPQQESDIVAAGVRDGQIELAGRAEITNR